MYVVFAEELEYGPPNPRNSARTLDEAFARICCHCGLSYRFEPAAEYGWCLFLTDVARPERSPEPIYSTYDKPRDAQHDLMTQAVDGRIRGHIAVASDDFAKMLIIKTGERAPARVGA